MTVSSKMFLFFLTRTVTWLGMTLMSFQIRQNVDKLLDQPISRLVIKLQIVNLPGSPLCS